MAMMLLLECKREIPSSLFEFTVLFSMMLLLEYQWREIPSQLFELTVLFSMMLLLECERWIPYLLFDAFTFSILELFEL